MKTRVAFCVSALLLALACTVACAGEPVKPGEPDPLEAWWKTARARIEATLEAQGRTLEAIESPKWFEQVYNTAGRMPLVDLCLGSPLVMPEVAGWADLKVRDAGGRFLPLFDLAEVLAAACKPPSSAQGPGDSALPQAEAARLSPVLSALETRLRELELPAEASKSLRDLVVATGAAHLLRDKAFAGLDPADRKRLSELLPAYFVRQTPMGESIRGFTSSLDGIPELLDLLREVDFQALNQAGRALAAALDGFRAAWKGVSLEGRPATSIAAVFEAETFFGRILVAGSGNNTHSADYAVLVDLGGNDTYLNHAAATSLDGPGAAVVADLSGNDRYIASGKSQACAECGSAALIDMAGDDVYLSGHYSQGAALCGSSFFADESGDDTYLGGLGAQGFAIFGFSLFHEGGGRDSYRCASMGQGCASTLGVAVFSEAGGDDTYRSGGKYGFYETWDASCAQGAASGMRHWPPTGKITVYGGVGLFCEAGGNDVYSNCIIGQGGSYLFGLGMFIDSAGNDVYTGIRYNRGVGVHLGAGIAIDRKGDDFHAGDYMENAVSLDRSAGIFMDLDGDDVYRIRYSNGFAFDVKPRGFSCFVDAAGDDVYDSTAAFGFPDKPWGEDTESTAYFFDFGGRDVYPASGKAKDNAVWTERAFGRGEDAEIRSPARGSSPWWSPSDLPALSALPLQVAGMASHSPLVRFSAERAMLDPAAGWIEALLPVAKDGNEYARKDLIDVMRLLLLQKRVLPADLDRLVPLLDSPDRDLRILCLWVMAQLKAGGPAAVEKAGQIATADPSQDARGIACLALGKSGSKESLAPLLAALKSPFPAVRRRAALGLSDLKAPEAAADLVSALESEPWHEARGRAADALGALRNEAHLPALRKALLDQAEMVRFFAARSLLRDFGRTEAMEHLISLARWDGGAVSGILLWTFLKAYTGKDLPGTEKDWRAWWEGASRGFDTAKQGRIYAMCEEADEAARKGDEDRMVEIYRGIRKIDPRHAAACEEVSKALNSRAWEIALSGKNSAEGLKLAEEAADAKADSDIMDTLAVLRFQTGDKAGAEEVLQKALKTAKEDKAEMLKRRIDEVKAGKLKLD